MPIATTSETEFIGGVPLQLLLFSILNIFSFLCDYTTGKMIERIATQKYLTNNLLRMI